MDHVTRRKFLGFSFYRWQGGYRIRVDKKSIKRLMDKLRFYTSRSKGWSMDTRIKRLNQVIRGWVNYFSLADMQKLCIRLDAWLRRRLRMCYWKQWKRIKTKHDNLIRLGIPSWQAWEHANTRKSYWHTANSWILACTLTNDYLAQAGLVGLSDVYRNFYLTNRRMPNGTYGGVRGQLAD